MPQDIPLANGEEFCEAGLIRNGLIIRIYRTLSDNRNEESDEEGRKALTLLVSCRVKPQRIDPRRIAVLGCPSAWKGLEGTLEWHGSR